jgi:hypothetical protein
MDTPASVMDDLRAAGLVSDGAESNLTPKGRDWLRALEDADGGEHSRAQDDAADLVLSTSGLSR